jgi:hypothetical protein
MRHVKVADRFFIEVQSAGVTFTTARMRVRTAGGPVDLEAEEKGVRAELADGTLAIFSERTFEGARKKKE